VSDEPTREDVMYGAVPELAAKATWTDRDIYISGPDTMITQTVQREAAAHAEPEDADLPGAVRAGGQRGPGLVDEIERGSRLGVQLLEHATEAAHERPAAVQVRG
jgi:hypothetical protein